MKIKILDAATLGDDIKLDMFDEFGEVTAYPMTTADEVEERIADSDILIINKIKLNETNLPSAPNLKLICITATGFDNVDTDYCRAHNIAVCNVKGYSSQSVAQVTLALVLELFTHTKSYTQYVADGSYTRSGLHNYLKPCFHEISGLKWGVVGLGGIGVRVAKIAEAMGCEVLAFNRRGSDEFTCADLDTICRECDIISVHLPLSDETRAVISRERIGMMKKTAVLCNMARGAVIDEEAAACAIENGTIAGLCSDVYSVEPMQTEHPFNRIKDRENVLLTPHMAWGAYEARMRCMMEIVENIRAFLDGRERNRV